VSNRIARVRLTERLEEIVGLGNRFAGTEGEQQCRRFLFTELTELGLSDVREESFPYLAYERTATSCVADDALAMSCAPLQYTADTVAEGEAVYLGAARPEDVQAAEARGLRLEGKVVVAHSYFTFLVAPFFADRGIAALVNVGDTPDGLVGNFTAQLYPPPLSSPWEGRVLPFPGVTIEAAAAQRLLSLMTLGRVRVRVEHRARYVEKEAANIVAAIPGGSESERDVVVGAHYDTQLEGPGASDNSTGLAALLQFAESWRSMRPRRTITLVAFAVEEEGLWGSYNYCVARRDELDRTVAMVNLDAMGLPFPGTRVLVVDRALAGFARNATAETGWIAENELEASRLPAADYAPFIDAGVPGCWVWRYPPQHPYYHSAGDILAYVDLRRFEEDARASAQLALALADVPDVGLGRAQPHERRVDMRNSEDVKPSPANAHTEEGEV
jgi:hypothetical protein